MPMILHMDCPTRPRWVAALLTLGLAIAVAGVVLGNAPDPPEELGDWGLAGCLACSAITCSYRARIAHRERTGWLLVATGLWAYTLGTVIFAVWIKDAAHPPFPSISDWMWLGLPVCAAAGVLSLARARGVRFSLASVLDGVIVASALAGLLAAVVYEPVYRELMSHHVAFGMVPPLSDLAVLAVLVVGMSARRWRPDSFSVLAMGAFAVLTFGDCVYSLAAASTGWSPGTWIDLPYAAGATLLGLAAWRPARAIPAPPAWEVRALAIPLAAGCAAVGLITADLVADLNPVVDVSIVLLVSAVVARMGLALRSYGAILASTQTEAQTDALTGLRNRRRLFLDLDRPSSEPRTLLLFDLDGFKTYNDTLGHGPGDDLLAGLGHELQAAVQPEGKAYRMGGDEFCVVSSAAARTGIVARAASALHAEAGGCTITCSWGEVTLPDEARSGSEALRLADRRMYAMKNGRPNAPATQLREALARVVRIREPDLHDHVVDVGRMAAEVGRRLGLPEHSLADIVHGAELHDVGKLAIPQSILDKPGRLNEEEWTVMRRHTILGEQLLAGISGLATAARLVRSSHERWDGGGYPDNISGESIPLGARIIAVCDAYDAMVTDRPYGSSLGHEAAIHELRRCAATQFDPVVVRAFEAVIDEDLAVAEPAAR